VRDDGQDVVEYALLTATIGLIGFGAWALVSDSINNAYGTWDTGVNDLWEPPDPQ
jgi:hypothetical protein